MSWPEGTPNPGSIMAIQQGCLCPALDNHHGEGTGWRDPDTGEPTFWLSPVCPVHNPVEDSDER